MDNLWRVEYAPCSSCEQVERITCELAEAKREIAELSQHLASRDEEIKELYRLIKGQLCVRS